MSVGSRLGADADRETGGQNLNCPAFCQSKCHEKGIFADEEGSMRGKKGAFTEHAGRGLQSFLTAREDRLWAVLSGCRPLLSNLGKA